MRGRLIAVRDMSRRDEEAWHDLAARAVEPNPLCEPDCVIPAARHQTFGDEISLVVAEDNGTFLACVPVRPMRRWYNIRYPIVANKIRRSTYVGTPLVDATGGTDAVATVLSTLADHRRSLGCRLFGLDSLREGGPVAHYVYSAAALLGLPVYVHEDFERAFCVRRPDASYFAALSAKRRKAIRRSRRMLFEEFGSAPVIVDRSHDLSSVEQYIALEAAGYKSVNGVALATVPGEAEYFQDMCQRFATSKNLLALSLECAGRTLGMQIWLRGKDGLFGVKVAYDERYATFGPGALLHVEMFEHVHHQTDVQWIDTCAGPNNQFLFGLYPDRTRISTLLFGLGGPVDHLFVRSLPRVRALHQRWRAAVDGPSSPTGKS